MNDKNEIGKYIFRKEKKKDLSSIISLLEKSRLPTEHILDNVKNFIVAEFKDRIIGCGCLIFYNNFVEIRSLAVEKKFQRKGTGSKIAKRLLKTAKGRNIKTVYIRTLSHNKDFFLKLGFKELPQEMLLDLFEVCKTCERYAGPKCAALMKIEL